MSVVHALPRTAAHPATAPSGAGARSVHVRVTREGEARELTKAERFILAADDVLQIIVDEGQTDGLVLASWRVEQRPSTMRQRDEAGDSAAKRPRQEQPASPALGFQLSQLHEAWVASGLVPAAANSGTARLCDLLSPSALSGATELWIINYMIDLDMIVAECPAVRSVPRVVVVHGDGHAPESAAVRADPARFVCLQPPCER